MPRQHFQYFPVNYEEKVGFDKVRELLQERAESPMGREKIVRLRATNSFEQIQRRLGAVREMMQLLSDGKAFPSLSLQDLRHTLESVRVEGTFLEEGALSPLRHFLQTVSDLYSFLRDADGANAPAYPVLTALLVVDIESVPRLLVAVHRLLDRFGRICDSASSELGRIRREKVAVERASSRIARQLLAKAIEAGWCEADAQPTIREGHLVLPVIASHKRAVSGVVMDESATGKTFFIEPLEVIESNNRLRELEAEERKEIIRILIEFTASVRPHIAMLLSLYKMLGTFDAIRAMARFSLEEKATVPRLHRHPHLLWRRAKHPVLRRSLEAQQREIVPLDITLEARKGRILLISGPNAGGKSVCLKTCGLLQLMLQTGLPIPVDADSEVGIFDALAINIGDDQSIENDLSTYSSHLRAMSLFCKIAAPGSLLMIDEFGAGTEPEIGGAIAESLLAHFNKAGAFGVITTHYRNLKEFATRESGIVNGAMLYDRGKMQPLFTLSIGQPGSSFAMEIAKRSGLPSEVLSRARDLVGEVTIESDSYVQDIARDKRYWEQKREEIRRKNIHLEAQSERYREHLERISDERRKILEEARKEAEEIIRKSNARVEQAVKEIRETQAEKERTRELRRTLSDYASELAETPIAEHDRIEEKLRREREKVERRQERKRNKKAKGTPSVTKPLPQSHAPYEPAVGDAVKILATGVVGDILSIDGKELIVCVGNALQMRVASDKVTPAKPRQTTKEGILSQKKSSNISDQLHEKRSHFRTELDVRGMRAEEAIRSVDFFIDDALQLGFSEIRILHGTGTGALRESIRRWLSGNPYVTSFRDEDVRFGGAGITIVNL